MSWVNTWNWNFTAFRKTIRTRRLSRRSIYNFLQSIPISMALNTVIEILHAAQKEGIDLILTDNKIQLKVAKGAMVEPHLLEQIKANRSSIIALLKSDAWRPRKVKEEAIPPAISIGSDITDIPLSFGQERLWIIDQLGQSS